MSNRLSVEWLLKHGYTQWKDGTWGSEGYAADTADVLEEYINEQTQLRCYCCGAANGVLHHQAGYQHLIANVVYVPNRAHNECQVCKQGTDELNREGLSNE